MMFSVALFIACDANYVFASFCLSCDANGATQIVLFLLVKIQASGALVVGEETKTGRLKAGRLEGKRLRYHVNLG